MWRVTREGQRMVEGALGAQRARVKGRAPTTMLRMVPLPVRGRIITVAHPRLAALAERLDRLDQSLTAKKSATGNRVGLRRNDGVKASVTIA